MPTPEETPCPHAECDAVGLVVEPVLVAAPPGTYSLAGVQPKSAARGALRWRCPACGACGPAQAG